MTSMPITPNALGLKNVQQRFALALLTTGTVTCLLALFRVVQARSGSLPAYEMAVAVAILLFALRRLYVGASLALAVLVDTVGPAGVEKAAGAVPELLQHRRIWTYQRPQGLIRTIYYRIAPQFIYLTPPYQDLVNGLALNIFLFLPAIAVAVWLGPTAVPLIVVVLVAGLARVAALRRAINSLGTSQPSVETYEAPEHLTEAGNPIDLYNHVRIAFERLRENQFQNRFLVDREPNLGVNAATNKCQADLVVETQPLPITDSSDARPTANLLDAAGAVLEIAGFAVLLFVTAIAQTPQDQAFWGAAAIMAIGYGSRFLLIAQRLHYSFRFRSDVIWLSLSGSYVLNKVAVGGGLAGLPSTEGHSIKSDLHVFIRGTRWVTECSPRGGSAWDQVWGTTKPAEQTLQHEPRYIVSAQMDAVFAERLNWIVKSVLHYQDVGTQLRTPDLQTADAQGMLAANLQLNRLMHSAAQQGTIEGQQAASGNALPPGGPISALPLNPPPQLQGPTAKPTSSLTGHSQQSQPPSAAGTAQRATVGNPPPPPPHRSRHQSTSPSKADVSQQASKTVSWCCSKCSKQLKAPRDWAGKTHKCSGCGMQQIVPRS